MFLGSSPIDAIYLGSTLVSKIYVGGTQAWPTGGEAVSLAGSLAAVSALAGALSTAGPVTLAGALAGVSAMSGSLTVPVDASIYQPVNLDHGTEIVAVGTSSDFDERIREIGNVLYDPTDTGEEYKLVYTGYQGAYDGNDTFVGYAYSSDGLNWTKGGKLTLGADRNSEDPYLVKSGSTYYLYVEDKEDVPFRDIRCYTSTDFSTWTDQGEVLGPAGAGWEATDVSSPTVWIEGSTWYMLYEGRGTNQNGAVGLATSSDGLTWTKDAGNPVLVGQNATYSYAGPIAWADALVPDDIVKVDTTYILHFHGRTPGRNDFRSGVATSADLETWTDALSDQLHHIGGPDGSVSMLTLGSTPYFLYAYPGGGITMAQEGAGDASWSSVLLYLSCYEHDAATAVDDLSIHWREDTFFGNAQIDDAQSKFGPSSLLLDGTGDYVRFADDTDWDLGTSAFTIELWARKATTGQMMMVTQAGAATNVEAWYIQHTGTNLAFLGRINGSTTISVSGAATMNVDTWYHVAVDRQGSDFKVYLDGAVVATASNAGSIQSVANEVRIGARDHGTTPLYFNGHIEGVRITKGVARYQGAFTPPTAPYPVGPVPA
jgi:hypothetical protein